jgi:hypothetical protein
LRSGGFVYEIYQIMKVSKKGLPMKRLLTLGIVLTAIFMFSESNANAQTMGQGYQFGVGINTSRCVNDNDIFRYGYLGCGRYPDNSISREFRREQSPFFARFPPVYYSHIVKRPYGVSPYAAPAGIMPVEMGMKPEPLSITNPFFKPNAAPAKVESKNKPKLNDKMTWAKNSYQARIAKH